MLNDLFGAIYFVAVERLTCGGGGGGGDGGIYFADFSSNHLWHIAI